MNLNGRIELFTSEDCIPDSHYKGDFENQFVVISDHHVKENFMREYQKPEFQIFYAQGGFGCKTYTSGTAVIGTFLADGEHCRLERPYFAGILKPELVESLGLEVPKDEE